MKKLNTFKPSDSIVLERDMEATIDAVDDLPISKEDQTGFKTGDKLFLKNTQQVVLWFGFNGTTMTHQLISKADYEKRMDGLSPVEFKPVLARPVSDSEVDGRLNLYTNHYRSFYYLNKVPSNWGYDSNKTYYKFEKVSPTEDGSSTEDNRKYKYPYECYYGKKITGSNGNFSMLELTGDKTQWGNLGSNWGGLEEQLDYFNGQDNLWQIFIDTDVSPTNFVTKRSEGLWTFEPVRKARTDLNIPDMPDFEANKQYYVYKDFGNAFVSLEPGKLYELYNMTKVFTVIDIYQEQKYPGTNNWRELGTAYGSTEMNVSNLPFWRTYDSTPKGKLGPCVLIGSTVEVYANRITNRDGNGYTGKDVVVSMQWKDPEDIIDPKNPENNAIWAYTVVVRKRITGYQSHQSPTVFGMQDALMGNLLLKDGSGVRGDFVAPYDQIASSSDATEIMRSSVRNQFSENGLVFKDVVPLDGEYMYELFAVTETGIETGTHENPLYRTSMEELSSILSAGNQALNLLHLGDVIAIPHSILGNIEFEIVDINVVSPPAGTRQHTLTLMSRNALPYGVYDAPELDSYSGGSGTVKHPGASSTPSTTTSGCSNWHNSNLRQWLNSSSRLEPTTDIYWYEGKRYWRSIEEDAYEEVEAPDDPNTVNPSLNGWYTLNSSNRLEPTTDSNWYEGKRYWRLVVRYVYEEVETPVDPHTVNPSLNGWYTYTNEMRAVGPYDRLPGDNNDAALYRDSYGNLIPGFLSGFDETVLNMLLPCHLTTVNDPSLNVQSDNFPVETDDKVWIPSIDQLFGSNGFEQFREGTDSLGSVIRSSEATGKLIPYYTRTHAGAAKLVTVNPKDEVTKAPIGTTQGEITGEYPASYTEDDRKANKVPGVVICMVLTGHVNTNPTN